MPRLLPTESVLINYSLIISSSDTLCSVTPAHKPQTNQTKPAKQSIICTFRTNVNFSCFKLSECVPWQRDDFDASDSYDNHSVIFGVYS
jgi:hypothetical protein